MTMEMMIPVTEAREKLKALLEILPERNVVLVRHSRPAAVILSPQRYDDLMSRIEDLEDELSILASKLNPDDSVPWEKVKAAAGLMADAG